MTDHQIPESFIGGSVTAMLGFFLIRVVAPYALKLLMSQSEVIDIYRQRDFDRIRTLEALLAEAQSKISELQQSLQDYQEAQRTGEVDVSNTD